MNRAETQGRRGVGRRRAALWTVGCGLAALAACNEIGTPLRPPSYGYSLIVSDSVLADTTVNGIDYFADSVYTDTVDFAWPQSALPVKIWVQDTAGLPEDLNAAIAGWKHVLQYAEFDATIVADSNHADIIVRGSNPGAAPVGPLPLHFASNPAACEGGTDVFVSAPDHTKLWLPVRMYVLPKYLLSDTATQACLARVTMHELGHALGLFKHSPDPTDLMYAFPSVDAPSDADAATILQLYHQQSDLRPARGTDTLPSPTTRP